MLSEVADRIRGGHAFTCRTSESGPWRQTFPIRTGIGFHVIERGTISLTVNDGPSLKAVAGDVIFAPTGSAHSLQGEDIAFLSGCYHLADTQVHAALRQLPPVSVVAGSVPRLAELCALLGDDLIERPGAEATRASLVGLIVVQVLRHVELVGAWPVSDPAVAAAVRSVHRDPDVPWTVELLSSRAGLSRTAFTRRFTALVGSPPMAYVRNVRLSAAARILRETNAPLASVARQSGYSNEFSLATAFRQAYGIAPGRYRTGFHNKAHQREVTHTATATGSRGSA